MWGCGLPVGNINCAGGGLLKLGVGQRTYLGLDTGHWARECKLADLCSELSLSTYKRGQNSPTIRFMSEANIGTTITSLRFSPGPEGTPFCQPEWLESCL